MLSLTGRAPHQGHFTSDHLPLARGFDSFFGFYSGYIDYFSHESGGLLLAGGKAHPSAVTTLFACHASEIRMCSRPDCYLDWQDSREGPQAASGEYGTIELSAVVDDVIRRHDSDTPFFLYYAVPNVHEPLMAPDHIFAAHSRVLDKIPNTQRRTFAAMLVMLDETVANVTHSLRTAGMYERTILVFASDNGANALVQGSGSNFPLRGQKGYLFEGGFRVPAFIHSPLIPQDRRGASYENLFHVSDWLPTLLDGVLDRASLLAGRSLNGVNHWNALLGSSTSIPRSEILYNIDMLGDTGKPLGFDVAAVRVDKWKLILNELNVSSYPVPVADVVMQNRVPNNGEAGDVRHNYLFDLDKDPGETTNLYDAQPDVVRNLTTTLTLYRNRMVDCVYCSMSDNASYVAWDELGGFVGPWRESGDLTCRGSMGR